MPHTIRSWVKIIGDVKAINGPQVTVETVNTTSDMREFRDEHPVLVADESILKKIKIGASIKISMVKVEVKQEVDFF